MPRAAPFLILLAAAASAFAAPQQSPLQPPPSAPQPPPDPTPSDPAALAFLETTVDPRVYTLEAAGAANVKSNVHATIEGAVASTVALDVELQCDLKGGGIALRPLGKLDDAGRQLLSIVYANAQLATPILPSRLAANFVVKFAPDADLVKLEYTPRTQGGATRTLTEWYKLDGTPVRRMGELVGPDGAKITQDAIPEFTEVEGRLLIKAWKPAKGTTGATVEFEYTHSGAFHVLKRLVQRTDTTKIVLAFETTVTAKEKEQEKE